MFMLCLRKLGVFTEEDNRALVLRLFLKLVLLSFVLMVINKKFV